MSYSNIVIGLLFIALSAGIIQCGSEQGDRFTQNAGIQIDTKLKYENDLFYPLEGDEPFTGEVVWRYPEGALAARIQYEDGHLVSRKGYYRDGQILNHLELTNDTLVTSITWYPSGQMKTKYDRGLVKEWYYNGQLRAVWNTDSAGVLEGKATAWYPDGSLMGVENYKDGELDGERVMYDSTGTITENGTFSEGQETKTN